MVARRTSTNGIEMWKKAPYIVCGPQNPKKANLKIYWTHLQNLIQLLEVQTTENRGQKSEVRKQRNETVTRDP